MNKYVVSARKYRPASFDAVVGQQALTVTLKNAIAKGKLAHAYLFCGPRGVGKTTCARIFAKTINCLTPTANGDACNTCESCVAFNENRSYNIHELDAASNNSVEDIRELIEQVQIPPQIGKYKVFIIDEVHMLSTAAFNAFLKTLEEPPAHAIFILATTEKHKILPTILSRCQIYDFARMTVADTVRHLQYVAEQEHFTYEAEALHVIAEKADGGMRDALSIFDQIASFCEGNITYQKVIESLNVLDYDQYFAITDELLKGEIPAAMLRLNTILSRGFEGNYFIGGLASHFRNLLMSRDEQTLPLLDVSEQVRARYHEQAKCCQPKLLYRALKLCNDCDINYRTARNKRLLVELTLIEVAQACTGEDDPSCGRRPIRRLKPLFTQAASTVVSKTASAAQPTVQPAQPAAVQHVTGAVSQVQVPTGASAAVSSLTEQLAASQHNTRSGGKMVAKTISVRSLRQQMGQGPLQQQATASVVAESSENYSSGTAAKLSTPFTLDTLLYYWHRYANQLPREDSAIAGRMRNMNPKLLSNYEVEVLVENNMVEQYMRSKQIDLMNYLRTNLRNDYIILRFTLAQEEGQQRTFSRLEQLNELLNRSAALTMLKKELSLELA
ncbi:MAG: DNA polymerase III subunit gamma/tau [Alloprevotella sp.]